MAINYQVLNQGTLVYSTVPSTFTDATMIEYTQTVIDDPTIKPRFMKLFDITGVCQFNVTQSGLS